VQADVALNHSARFAGVMRKSLRLAATSLRPFLALAVLLGCCLQASADPAMWRDEINRLIATDATQPPPTGGAVFVGSSSIRLWESLARDFPQVATINRGFGGSELADSVYYADRIVIPYRPKTVVLFAGTNDIWAGKSPETVAADFKAFRTKVHAALPDTKILYLSLNFSPSRVSVLTKMRQANELIAADCATAPGCIFVDVCTPMLDAQGQPQPEYFREDQLHMKPAGYAIWTRILTPYLQP
jgi:lysophospholipase L1-like esterase